MPAGPVDLTVQLLCCVAWINISQHAMNSAYALFEITLTNAGPSPWLHLPLCIFMLACYLGVAYITHATQGFYSAYLALPTSPRVTLASPLHPSSAC